MRDLREVADDVLCDLARTCAPARCAVPRSDPTRPPWSLSSPVSLHVIYVLHHTKTGNVGYPAVSGKDGENRALTA